MAMTKKEQAEMQALRDQLALSLAWRRTAPVVWDVPIPTAGVETTGYVFNRYSEEIIPAWSTISFHGIGAARSAKGSTASQRGRSLYSTKERALRALRYSVEEEAAKRLAAIDNRIADELDCQGIAIPQNTPKQATTKDNHELPTDH